MLKPLRIFAFALWFAGFMPASSHLASAETVPVRVGVLAYGTVHWELDTIRSYGLDTRHGVEIQMIRLAGRDATTIALHAGHVDVIVIDWIWASRERAAGRDYTFAPFSKAVGGLVVPEGSGIEDLADLAGRRIGIAGGPLDKSWLLLRALARQEHGVDLDATADKLFGAPPLLNEQLRMGRIDAVVTYWQFVARLEAEGMTRLLDVSEAARRLGLDAEVPLLGFVFSERWAEHHRTAVLGLLRASRAAKELLAHDDQAWERLRPLMQAEGEAAFVALRNGFREGIPTRWGAEQHAGAERLFAILAELGGRELVGRSRHLQPGTFWAAAEF